MSTTETSSATPQPVDLKNPSLAAFLGFLIPGLGHLYQGRTGKGILFMICILGMFFYGLYLSSGEGVGVGRAVYLKWKPDDRRFYYFGQMFVGLPAAPALLQAVITEGGTRAPMLNGFMAPPAAINAVIPGNTSFHEIRKALNKNFELGTLYTVIAGLMNLLVIFDAAGGIVVEPVEEESEEDEKKKQKRSGWRKWFGKPDTTESQTETV